jgi:hypothetical protein
MDLCQVGIMLLGCPAVVLIGYREKWARWGFLLGLSSQPFWIYESITHKQWGILIVTILYTWAWGLGVYKLWIKKG